MQELMISAKLFKSEEARMKGLVHYVVPASQMEAQLESLVKQILDCGPESVRETKKLIKKVATGLSAASAKKETTGVIAKLRVGKEGQEGLKSFLEKKTPSWRNS
jgi:methylglutaconyl-CoA hydratase